MIKSTNAYYDVINDKDHVGLKRVTEDRELRKYNRRYEPQSSCMHEAADDPSSVQAYNNSSFSCQMPVLP